MIAATAAAAVTRDSPKRRAQTRPMVTSPATAETITHTEPAAVGEAVVELRSVVADDGERAQCNARLPPPPVPSARRLKASSSSRSPMRRASAAR